jgi:hypothetical protein
MTKIAEERAEVDHHGHLTFSEVSAHGGPFMNHGRLDSSSLNSVVDTTSRRFAASMQQRDNGIPTLFVERLLELVSKNRGHHSKRRLVKRSMSGTRYIHDSGKLALAFDSFFPSFTTILIEPASTAIQPHQPIVLDEKHRSFPRSRVFHCQCHICDCYDHLLISIAERFS